MSMQGAEVGARPSAPALPVAVRSALRSPLLIVGAITILAAVLRLDKLGVVHTNSYYDAAVRSMSYSWHNFFYGAYDPAGILAIDKPPIDLWLQVLSTQVFGWNPTALILPQALAATAAVPLLYDTVRRVFGPPAGIAAAAALAVMPLSVLTSRSDTMDSLMMFMSVLAAWLVVRAVEKHQVRWLYLAALVAGLNFEVKLFEALAAVPALFVLYALASSESLRRRALHLAVAGAVFLAAAVWWPVAVSLSPHNSRPYPIGSTNGSVWNVIFVFNGSARIKHTPQSSATTKSFNGSAPGPGRLFDRRPFRYGVFLGIELLASLLLAPLALLLARRPRGPLQWGFVAALALWLLPSFLLFSEVTQLHLRYLEAFTPAIAATLGIAVAALTRAAGSSRAAAAGLVAGIAGAAAYAVSLGRPGATDHTVTVVAAVGAALLLAIAAARGKRMPAVLALAGVLALVTVLAGPTARSATIVKRNESDSGHPGETPPRQLRALTTYLAPRTRGDRYEVASAYYPSVGSLIAHDARPVLPLTSVQRVPVVKLARLKHAVSSGQVHYFLVSGSCAGPSLRSIRRCKPTIRWSRRHSVDVSRDAGLPAGFLFRYKRVAG